MSKIKLDKLKENLEFLKKYFRGQVPNNQVQAERAISQSLEMINAANK